MAKPPVWWLRHKTSPYYILLLLHYYHIRWQTLLIPIYILSLYLTLYIILSLRTSQFASSPVSQNLLPERFWVFSIDHPLPYYSNKLLSTYPDFYPKIWRTGELGFLEKCFFSLYYIFLLSCLNSINKLKKRFDPDFFLLFIKSQFASSPLPFLPFLLFSYLKKIKIYYYNMVREMNEKIKKKILVRQNGELTYPFSSSPPSSPVRRPPKI